MPVQLRRRLAHLLLALSLLGMAAAAFNLQTRLNANAAMAALLSARASPILPLGMGQPLPVLQAQAVYLSQHERVEAAQDLLNYLASRGDDSQRAMALYNLGNLHLRRALAKIDAGELQQAMPFAAMAKDAYRRALALNPALWDGKYNLEAAMRLSPDLPRINVGDDEAQGAPPKALWTEIPGFPRGQP